MSISCFGKNADAQVSPDDASIKHAFTDELPISYPNKNLLGLSDPVGFESTKTEDLPGL
jgi:hypothetical protein